MQISRNIVKGPKRKYGFGGKLGYCLRPETISPLFADLKIVFRGSSLYPKHLSLFCLL